MHQHSVTAFKPQRHALSAAAIAVVAAIGALSAATPAWADPSFLAVAAGDATATSAIVWTRATEGSITGAGSSNLTLQVATDAAFSNIVKTQTGLATRGADWDNTLKVDVTGLASATRYFYRFTGATTTTLGSTSAVGSFTTTPGSNAAVPVRFSFSGDADGLMRPYPLANNFQQNTPRDFFVFLGDTMYETASTGSAAAAAPTLGANPGNLSTVLADYQRKYRENLQGVTSAGVPTSAAGQQGLAALYAAQGNYTLLDNHELGNKQYINGGAPIAALSLSGNGALASAGMDHNTTGVAINSTDGYKTFLKAYDSYQPVREVTGADGLQQMYLSRDWGKNLSYISTDDRTYRDVRLTKATGGDDTPASYITGNTVSLPAVQRWADPTRTSLGTTQMAWLKQTLLDQQAAGQVWKVVSLSSPIDQAGNDGGKSWYGGYQADRNSLLKFIDDNGISNVVFLSTDDHYSRANELWYSDGGSIKRSSAFTIVTGPIGATGPVNNNHSFANQQALLAAATAQLSKENTLLNGGMAGNSVGLADFGSRISNVKRDQNGVLTDGSFLDAINFFSIDTNAYTNFDIDADGTMHVKVWGIDAYASNAFPTASADPRIIFQFDMMAAAVPEPAHWALLLAGLGVVLTARRRVR